MKFYLGIDQTGAIRTDGSPKALPACLLEAESKSIWTGDDKPLYLESFSLQAIQELFANLFLPLENLNVLVDCVFGIASEIQYDFLDALNEASLHPAYGKRAAQSFFARYHSSATSYPRREVEVLCNANSLFQIYPAQKNIQTGSYRIWKQLAQQREHFAILPFEEPGDRIAVYECYPSYYWKSLLGEGTRRPDHLSRHIQDFQIQPQTWDFSNYPDHADALLNALAGYQYLYLENWQMPSHAEGWILGVR